MSKNKQYSSKIILIVGGACLIVGYLLGSLIGFGNITFDSNSRWAGTYTTEVWSGSKRVSLVLNKDGTCKLPTSYQDEPCRYEVIDGRVYFNDEQTSDTTIGDEGLVYKDTHFAKLK